ncbi:MAG: multicopper oxidase domain-containing protein [Pseudohongiellaceae bacterium]
MTSPIHCFLLLSLVSISANAAVVSYEFDIDTQPVNITGKDAIGLSIGGQIPAPLIEARVGDILRVTFHNRLDVESTVHWHGILLPGDQDGVAHLNTHPMASGTSFTFEFPIRQSGTYWYHSHSALQIQSGVYGPIVLREADESPVVAEQVLLLSDWNDVDGEQVLRNLKKRDDFYALKKDSVQSWDRVLSHGEVALNNRIRQAFSRMPPMDLSDVGYDAFLINGSISTTYPLPSGTVDRMLLRIINGSTSSYFDLEYAEGPMTVVAADGLAVEPVLVQRLRISTAETYDVLVDVSPGASFEFRATSIDGTGYGSAYIGSGVIVNAPDIARPDLILISHADHETMIMPAAEATHQHDAPAAEVVATSQDTHQHGPEPVTVQTPAPVIEHMTDYQHLISPQSTTLPVDQPWREIRMELTGNMERYIWSFDGKTMNEASPILIRKGENVRFILSNGTMMHHPLHFHGHFFRVVNAHGDRSPLKHTVNIPPGGTQTIEFDANEDQDWLFHCHNQFHMLTGMTRVVSYMDSSRMSPEMSEHVIHPSVWFNASRVDLLSGFATIDLRLFNDRHEFRLKADSDLDQESETTATYNFHINNFVYTFAGVESRRFQEVDTGTLAVAGLHMLLPFLVDSEWRVDEEGEFRLELGSDLRLTRRIGFAWHWNTDEEHRLGLNFVLNENWSATAVHDSDYGTGFGFSLRF